MSQRWQMLLSGLSSNYRTATRLVVGRYLRRATRLRCV